MERAVRLWQAQEVLPTPRLQEPWYGYLLGYWTDDLQRDADPIREGRYAEVAEQQGIDGNRR